MSGSLPKTQALSSTTFKVPPLDGTLTLPGLYDWHYKHSPDHPLLTFEDEPGILRTICYEEAGQAITRVSQYILDAVREPIDGLPEDRPVIAILATSDTVTSFCVLIGILRLGWTVFPVSPRNSPQAIAALLSQTKSRHLLLSSDPAIQTLANSSLQHLSGDLRVQTHAMPTFEGIFPTRGPDPAFQYLPMPDIDIDAPAMILHSSGTTAYPTPIPWTHRAWIQFGTIPHYGELEWTGLVLACHAVPMFHGLGIVQTALAPSTGLVVGMFKPRTPATVPDPVNTLRGAVATKSDLVLSVPLFLEEWSKSEEDIRVLAGMKGAAYAGGPLGKKTGDFLTSKGVNIFNHYATTQTGIVTTFLPKQPGTDWEYMRFSPNREVHLVPDGHGAFEAVVAASNGYKPNKLNTKINGKDAYATSDLFVPHPTIDGLWKVFGRADDQIMHSTGEKTNPGPLEAILSRDPHIQSAVIFGRGQFNAGVIVQPKEQFAFDPTDSEKLVAFRNRIWPSIQAVNDYAPSHSRLFKEMILVASPDKPFTYTAKGGARRLAVIAVYEAEIEALYEAASESSQVELGGPSDWSHPAVLTFVRTVVRQTLAHGESVSDDVDLFHSGCDSLQATWIRNTILTALRKQHPKVARGLSSNLVFDHPSISALSSYISSSVAHHLHPDKPNSDADDQNGNKTSELHALVEKYASDLPFTTKPPVDKTVVDGEVVLLTGSTGSLGSSILSHLLQSSSVNHIFAVGRLTGDQPLQNGKAHSALYDRHLAAFRRHGLDPSLLDSPKVSFVVGDLASRDLGIEPLLLREIRSSLTHIIHNAWKVDFKLSVSSMEPMIAGVRNLADLALACPSVPKLVFISSVGVVRGSSTAVPEVAFPSPDFALGLGYGEAKWVAERVLDTISRRTQLKSTIARMGQLTGGPSGSWNESEWFPSLVKSSMHMRYLPDAEGDISWLSCPEAASALFDIAVADQKAPIAYVNVVHPRPTPWSSMIRYFSDALRLDVLPYETWLAMLKDMHGELHDSQLPSYVVAERMKDIPALRLLEFFEHAASRVPGPSTEPLGIPRLECQEAMKMSHTLQALQPSIDADTITEWSQSWSRSGFLR